MYTKTVPVYSIRLKEVTVLPRREHIEFYGASKSCGVSCCPLVRVCGKNESDDPAISFIPLQRAATRTWDHRA